MNVQIARKKSIDDIKIVAKKVIDQAKVADSQVVAVFDVSGSMRGMYQDGTVDALATRVLAVALHLDDNGTIPVYALDDGVKKLPELTAANLNGYTKELHKLVGGATNYAPSMNQVVKDAQEGDPMLVLLFTDGENYDEVAAAEALVKASEVPIFFQWYGIYRGRKPSFGFLQSMDNLEGRKVDNAGFSPLGIDIVDVSKDDSDDTALFEDMIKEYKDFPEKAKAAGVTWANLKKVQSGRKIFGFSF